jgi:glycosyltransferase involved in cell wall biosynthesis
MKKVMLTGPIGGVYGRDVEANLVAKALQKHYKLSFFSTGHIAKNTVCTNDIAPVIISSLREKFLKNPILFLCALTSWCANAFKNNLEDYSKNRINTKLIKKYNWDFKILEREIRNADIVICFVQLSSSYLSDIIKLCKKHKVKIVIRTTGYIASCPLDFEIVKQVDLFIHHSTSNKNNLEKFVKHNYSIIDQCSQNEEKLLRLNQLNSKINSFATIGRIVKEKNIDLVVDSFIAVSKSNDVLYVIGDGSELKQLKNKYSKCKKVHFLGFVENSSLSDIYKNVEAIIIPYYHAETGPLTGIEAMAAGKVVISSVTGAMPDRLKNIAYWYNDAEELKKRIIEVKELSSDEVKSISLKVRNKYLMNYTDTKIKNQYLKIINSLTHA